MTWYLDNTNLSTLAWNVRNRSAGWTVPGKTGTNLQIPGKHGAYWQADKTYDEGRLTLSMWAVGCYPDGSMPMDEDEKRKVRQNLDELTLLFSQSRRLLNLRQITGDDSAIINELSNPTLKGSSGTGVVLARNSIQNSYRWNRSNKVISKNLSVNPFQRGRTSKVITVTEDLYPDPLFNHRSDNAVDSLMRGYYYPIQQDSITTNQSYTPINSFNMYTGQAGGRGLISASRALNLPVHAWFGTIGKEVFAGRENGTVFFMQLKLNANAVSNTASVQVVPQVSTDGITWTTGATSPLVNLNKTDYSWLIVPATNLPAMSGSGSFFVRYQLRLATATNFNAGPSFDVNAVSIQDSPVAGNPWRGTIDPSLMIVGGKTTNTVNRAGKSDMGWSDFRKAKASEWEVVQGSTTAGTSPYAFAWHARDKSYNNEGNLSFTVFGGTRQTFRRVLPPAAYTMTDQKVWGRFWRSVPGTMTVRVTERTGSAGSYTYTPVVTGTLPGTGTTFSTPAFTTSPGKTYCLEFDVAKSTDGLLPSLTLRELHVSNGSVNTSIVKKGAITQSNGNAANCKYRGSIYNSTILGLTFKTFGNELGLPLVGSKSVTQTNVDWSKEAQGTFLESGKIYTEKIPFDVSQTEKLVAHVRGAIYLPPHLSSYPFKNSSDTAKVRIAFFTSSGTAITPPAFSNMAVSGSLSTFSVEAVPPSNAATAQVQVEYTGTNQPMSNFYLNQIHLIQNPAVGFTMFTGAQLQASASAGYPHSISWDGKPYFSTTSLSTGFPNGWPYASDLPTFPVFLNGYARDGYSMILTNIGGVGRRVALPVSKVNVATAVRIGVQAGAYESDRDDATVAVEYQWLTSTGTGIGTAISLGNLTTSVNHFQVAGTQPTNAAYLGVNIKGRRSFKDAYVYANPSPVIDFTSTSWQGFNSTSVPDLGLPEHPSSIHPTLKVSRTGSSATDTSSLTTGTVEGWDGPLLGGGYIYASTGQQQVTSSPIRVDEGYASAAIRTAHLAAGLSLTLSIQGATDAGIKTGTWQTIKSNSTISPEMVVRDADLTGYSWVRILISYTALNPGTVGIINGATLSPSTKILGSNFPGFFLGVRGSDGVSSYMGHIRQAWVEVVESIDMTSQAYGTIAEFSVNLNVPGAFWEDVYETTTTLTSNGNALRGTFYVDGFKGATAPMTDVIIELTPLSGTITKFRLEDKASGNFLTFELPSGTTGVSKVIIDTAMARVTNDKGGSLIKYVTGMGSSNIMTLSPYTLTYGDSLPDSVHGVPIIEWEANTGLSMTVTGRRKYLIS